MKSVRDVSGYSRIGKDVSFEVDLFASRRQIGEGKTGQCGLGRGEVRYITPCTMIGVRTQGNGEGGGEKRRRHVRTS